MPRLVYHAGLALVLLAGLFQLTDWLVRPPGLTEANLQRVRPGMTPRWAERVLGGPPTKVLALMSPHPLMAEGWFWDSPDGVALVECEGGRVKVALWLDERPSRREGIIDFRGDE